MKKFKESSEWNKFRNKKINVMRTLVAVIAIVIGTFVVGGIVSSPHAKQTATTGIVSMASVAGLAFAKRQGQNSEFRLFNGGGGTGEETAEQKTARIEKEKKEFLETVTGQFKKVLEEKGLDKLEPDKIPVEFKKINDEIELLKKANGVADYTELRKLVIAQGVELKAFKEQPVDKQYKSLKHEFADKLKEKKAQFDEAYGAREFKNGAVKIELKSVVDEMDSTTIGAGATNYSLTTFTGIISKIRKRITVYLSLVSSGTIGSPNAYWIEETTEAGTPIFIGEGTTKTKLSVLYVEKTASVRKIAVYGKMSWEWMKDLSQLVAYFQNNLMRRLDIATEDQLINGDGTGNNLLGIYLNATPYSAGSLLNTVTDANAFDVVITFANQIKKAFGTASAILVNPDTGAKMRTSKTSLGQPVMGMYGVANTEELNINGVRVIETTAIVADHFVGGDLSVMNVLFADGLTVRIGETGTDLIDNMKTIVLEQRLVQFESANDYKLIVKGTFTNAIAQLDGEVSE